MWSGQQEGTHCRRSRDSSEPVSLDGTATVQQPLLLRRVARQPPVYSDRIALCQRVRCTVPKGRFYPPVAARYFICHLLFKLLTQIAHVFFVSVTK
jgi:hypothetical protein